MTFQVGQRVVCVDASANPEYGHNGLIEGRIYVVRGIRSEIPNPPHWGVYIEGIPGHWRLPVGEIPFHPRRFRPIAERKTDISVFEELLTSTPSELKQVD
jgi:hypothetical protein